MREFHMTQQFDFNNWDLAVARMQTSVDLRRECRAVIWPLWWQVRLYCGDNELHQSPSITQWVSGTLRRTALWCP